MLVSYPVQFTSKRGKAKWKDGMLQFKNNKYVVTDVEGDWICANAKISGDITDKAVLSFFYIRTEDPDLIAMITDPQIEDTETHQENQENLKEEELVFDFLITFSTQIHKKVKNYTDGYLCITEDNFLVLYDDNKKKICRDSVGLKQIEVGNEFKMKNMYSVYIDQKYKDISPIKIAVERKQSIPQPKQPNQPKPFKTPYRKSTKSPMPPNVVEVIHNTPQHQQNDDEDILDILFDSSTPVKTAVLKANTTTPVHRAKSPPRKKYKQSTLESLDDLLPTTFSKCRSLIIHKTFNSSEHYIDTLLKCLYEHLQISIHQVMSGNRKIINCQLVTRQNEFYLKCPLKLDVSSNELFIVGNSDQFKSFSFIKCVQRVFGQKKSTDCLIEPVGSKNKEHLLELNMNNLVAIRLGYHFDMNVIDILLHSTFSYSPLCHYIATLEYKDELKLDLDIEWDIELECLNLQLNDQQLALINQIASSIFRSTCRLPITLCHGYFGCGKSYLMASSIMLIVNTLRSTDSQLDPLQYKILISANTNTAVDRVCLILVKMGFTEFVRVGSIDKIHPQLLPYSVSTQKEFKSMNNPELNELYTSVVKRDASSVIADAQVVACTCHSTTLKCMQQEDFPIVFLDESSQMTEPTSLLPLRFNCKRVIAFGDPKQLPPTIETNSLHDNGLECTLFERLAYSMNPFKIMTQYRCHSAISNLSSFLFYDNTVINGMNVPCILDLDPLLFINVEGQEIYDKGSCRNELEAKFIIDCIFKLHIPLNDIGIITPFKAQVAELNRQLLPFKETIDDIKKLQISTIDAFQGGEKRIIIASMVKTKTGMTSGFMSDERRLNVLITRAKSHLFIMGKKMALNSQLWKSIIGKCNTMQSTDFINKLN